MFPMVVYPVLLPEVRNGFHSNHEDWIRDGLDADLVCYRYLIPCYTEFKVLGVPCSTDFGADGRG